MIEGRPSRTAWRVAVRRAVHQLLDAPRVLDDPLAVPILGPEGPAALDLEDAVTPFSRGLRAFVVARSRFAEDELAVAHARGVRQYVVLGAGLDTSAYRSPWPELRAFEVDHPATQAWKRERLRVAGIAIPATLSFAPVDFETQDLAIELARAGLDLRAPTFFSWLGVTPYLPLEAATATLRLVASLPSGSGVVFDYAVARSALTGPEQAVLDHLSARVAAAGEPFRLLLVPADLRALVVDLAFTLVDDLDSASIAARYFSGRADGLAPRGALGRLVSARV